MTVQTAQSNSTGNDISICYVLRPTTVVQDTAVHQRNNDNNCIDDDDDDDDDADHVNNNNIVRTSDTRTKKFAYELSLAPYRT